ncbi:hypothetical protein PQQ63_33970 [Paraburkholderia metrosideri]|uniref:Uncharacterized protein n=1 Tax=Paraburkholderia metrosideri TaxID=580937 RepID=A0ABW9E289_9BURK
MTITASFFTRVLADVFPGKASSARPATPQTMREPSPAATAPEPGKSSDDARLRVIGQGEPNETHITIGGVPNLFVDEGDCVMQFVPAFDEAMKQTQFGMKVLPELEPHWSQVAMHRCNLKQAIAVAIRGSAEVAGVLCARPTAVARTDHQRLPNAAQEPVLTGMDDNDEDTAALPRRHAVSSNSAPDMAAVSGTVIAWGEEKFPRRKPGGPRFYTSFAIQMQTLSGERVLQGEGLKDAISESGCQVGDVVAVRRLRKIKVQAFDSAGAPKMKDGVPVLWDKWLWSITK